MISIDCAHPDVLDFIKLKTDLNKVTKANISIRLSNEFMEDVKEHKQFRINYSLLADKPAVDKALKRVNEIQAGRETEVRQTPLVDLTKG